MADISQVNLPDGSSFNVKDTIARSTKADRVPAPAEYDSTVTYHEGDICTHNGNVYYCHSSTTTGSWESNKWRLLTTPQQDYLHSIDPVGVGSFSLNRKVGTNVGKFSFAEGQENTANGMASHAEGNETIASGYSSHAEGFYTIANHLSQHAFGEFNIADTSTASASSRGNYIEIVGNGADDNARSNARTLDWNGNEVLAGGLKINGTQNVATQVSLTQAEYDALVQTGTVDLVNTVYFITDGNANANSASETTYDNTSSGLSATNVQGAIDEVVSEKADRVPAPAEYDSTSTYAQGDFVTYNGNIYICIYPITTAEAWNAYHWQLCTPQQDYLHSLDPVGNGSFSLNRKSGTTIGACSFAEGYNNTASDRYSHAEGYNTTASERGAHAEGWTSIASGNYSHAEGYNTTASGYNGSHAEGRDTIARGNSSHAEGSYTLADGNSSHAEGSGTIATRKSQHTFGEYNVLDASPGASSDRGNYVEIVGNGTADNARSNARTLDWNGNETLAGGLTTSGNIVAKDSNGNTKVNINSSNGDISCTGVNGIYWSASKDTYSNTSVTFTTSNTISSGHFIWIIGDANQQPIFSILAIHTTIRTGNIKNLGYAISAGVSDNSITITAPAWSSIRLVSDLCWV